MMISFEKFPIIAVHDHVPLSFDIISAHVMHHEMTLDLCSQSSSFKNDSPDKERITTVKNYVAHMLNFLRLATGWTTEWSEFTSR
jgi:hypothetical protein